MVESHLREVDKKIARGHQRLKLSKEQTLDAGQNSMLFGGPNDEKIKMLTERINDLVDQAETLGCEGEFIDGFYGSSFDKRNESP